MRVLLTGDYDRDEFASALADMAEAVDLVRVACLDAAARSLASCEPVNLIVVAQARPGQFSAREIDALRRAAPLTPIVALLGSWSEGEMRSGSPWPGVTRVYWHQWGERFREELTRLSRGELSSWAQPVTASTDERLLSSAKPHSDKLEGIVAVISSDCEIGDWLAAACQNRGMSVIKLDRIPYNLVHGVAIVLWDVGLFRPLHISQLHAAASRFPCSRIILLADFPRPEDIDLLLPAGAAAVLSKPLLVNDLYGCLNRLLAE